MFEIIPKLQFTNFVFFKKPRFNVNGNTFISGQIFYAT